MISVGEHRDVAVGPGDTVVFSARAHPRQRARGLARDRQPLPPRLRRRPPRHAPRVHVSGHASQDELVELIQRVRPRYLVPVHGEYRMLAQHARLAAQAGLPADRVLLAEDGDVLALRRRRARARRSACPPGRVLLDRSGVDELEEIVVRDRRHLSVGRHRGARGRAGQADRAAWSRRPRS